VLSAVFQPFLRFYRELDPRYVEVLKIARVSTLLEILLLMCLVVVGF